MAILKPSERFFMFPVLMYDVKSLRKAIKQEEAQEDMEESSDPLLRQLQLTSMDYEEAEDEEIEVDFVVGQMRVMHTDIAGWADSYKRDTKIKHVKKHGFDCVEVYFKDESPVICPLSRSEFETLYDMHVSKVEV